MRTLIASSMRLRTLVVTLAAVLAAFGGWHLRSVPLDVVPEFSPPSISVKTEALGLSAAEVEALITVPLEADLLNGVPFLQRIQSESAAGVSAIELVFVPGTDIMRARQMVQERLTQTHALPQVSSPPVMLQPVSTASRIMNVGMSSNSVSLIEMTVQAHWNIVPRLVGVPGVANVSIWGRRQRQVHVEVDPARLHLRGVTLEQVIKTAGEAVFASPLTFLNSSTPGTGGFIDTPNQRLNIRHLSPIATPEQFARVPVYETSYALGDIARVAEGHQPLIGDAIIGDGPGVLLVIEKFPGFNTQEVTRAVEFALAELKPGLPGIELDTTIYRPAGFIERATANLTRGSLIALGLALAIILLCFGNWRVALVAAVAIPLSLLTAAVVLLLLRANFDMLLLSGLMLAIGIVVHDAIFDAAHMSDRLRGAREVKPNSGAGATLLAAATEARGVMLFATVIALLCVAPVLFLQGLSTVFFRPLVLAYVVAILASFLVAATVTPALVLLLMRRAGPEHLRVGGLASLWPAYERRLQPLTRSFLPSAALAAVGLVVAVGAWFRFDRDLVPGLRETDLVIEWQAPDGTSLPAMSAITGNLIRELRGIPGVRNAAAQIGRAVLCNCDDVADVNSAEVWVSINPAADYGDTVEAIRATIAGYPGMQADLRSYLSKKMRAALTGDEERITVRLYGHDFRILRAKAEEVAQVMAGVPGIGNVRIEQQVENTAVEVEVDLDRAARYGLKPGEIRRATSTLVSGITVGALFEEQKVFDVVVWGPEDLRLNVATVEGLMLDTEVGPQVRLADVAHVRMTAQPSVIRRSGVSRRLEIDAEVAGRPVSVVARDLSARLRAVQFPFEYHAQVLGEHTERRAALRSVDSYFGAAAIVAALVLQAALRSWRLALASILGVPIVLLGAIVAIAFDESVITLGALLGIVAVLLVALRLGLAEVRAIQSVEQLHGPLEATDVVRRGMQASFAPTLATLLGTAAIALPFALMHEAAGLEILQPMAATMLGGLAGAAVVTLLLVPAAYLHVGVGSSRNVLELSSDPA